MLLFFGESVSGHDFFDDLGFGEGHGMCSCWEYEFYNALLNSGFLVSEDDQRC